VTTAATTTLLPASRLLRSASRVQTRTVIGGVLGFIVIVVIAAGPAIVGQDPYAVHPDMPLAGWSAAHWLGTDSLGRDIASRIAAGGRATLLISVAATAITSVIAIPLGVITGYFGGWVDLILTRIIDIFIAVPSLLIAIGIVGLLGPSLTTTLLALGLSWWPSYSRLVRATVVNLRSRGHVDACRVLGASNLRIIRTEIVSGLLPLVLVQTTVLLGAMILDEAALGFLGLGVQPPQPSWGSLLVEARQFMLSQPGQSVIVGIPILVAVLAINLLGDSVRDWVDMRRTGM
jgi:ABC-type dipeptide/oligopeptide/nickel transport system permease subunit